MDLSVFGVSPEKGAQLARRFAELGLREADLDEKFIRSSGPGGQNVNKVSSCVQLTHRPTGISVRCQQERAQVLNRFLARRILADKIEAHRTGIVRAERARVEKLRRQKRKRSKRAKAKMLEGKRHRGALKQLRAGVQSGGE